MSTSVRRTATRQQTVPAIEAEPNRGDGEHVAVHSDPPYKIDAVILPELPDLSRSALRSSLDTADRPVGDAYRGDGDGPLVGIPRNILLWYNNSAFREAAFAGQCWGKVTVQPAFLSSPTANVGEKIGLVGSLLASLLLTRGRPDRLPERRYE